MTENDHPEEWRTVEGWPYEVSSIGRVRNSKGIKKQQINKMGYFIITLWNGFEHWTRSVSRMVCEAFNGPPNGLHVRHLDGDSTNNRSSNLKWGTRKENEADKVLHGTRNFGEKHHNSKLSDAHVRHIRESLNSCDVEAALHNVSTHLVSQIRSGKRWKHLIHVGDEECRIARNHAISVASGFKRERDKKRRKLNGPAKQESKEK